MGRLHQDDRVASSSHSLHTIDNDDDDDLPPPYTDDPQFDATPSVPPPAGDLQSLRLSDSAYHIPGAKGVNIGDTNVVTYDPQLSSDSHALFQVIRRQMKLPVRPLLTVSGSHTESTNDGKKKTSNTVTDFSFRLDLAETMLRGWDGPLSVNWMELEIVQDGDGQRAFRGGILRSREYKARASRTGPISLDHSDAALLESEADAAEADAGEGTENPEDSTGGLSGKAADLKMWCERFCNDPAPVKSFTLHRELRGFDVKPMRNILDTHIRQLNYRGTTKFSLKNGYSSVTVYSPHWINRLRTNGFVWWVCVLLQLWIITWPVIWLMEKRYEIARSRWNASLDPGTETGLIKCYARGRDEAELAEFWAPAVKQAAWTKRQGEGALLTILDAQRVQGVNTEGLLGMVNRDSDAERERRDRINRGQGGFVDNVVGLVRGVSEVSQDYRLTMGWGANS